MAKEGSKDVALDPQGQKPATEETGDDQSPPDGPAEEEPDRLATEPRGTSRTESAPAATQTPPAGSSVKKKAKCGACGRRTYDLVQGKFDSLLCDQCVKAFPALVEEAV